jgi:mannose-6-phosphate isomerase
VAEKWKIHNPVSVTTDPGSLELLTVLEGHLQLGAVELGRAESVVLPASLGAYELSGEAVVVRCYVP